MLMAANLSNHQRRLNPDMSLVLMTDDRNAGWVGAARRLPHGSLVVVRARDCAYLNPFPGRLNQACLLVYEHGIVKADDLSRVNAAFFTMNGWVSVLFFVFWASDILLVNR